MVQKLLFRFLEDIHIFSLKEDEVFSVRRQGELDTRDGKHLLSDGFWT